MTRAIRVAVNEVCSHIEQACNSLEVVHDELMNVLVQRAWIVAGINEFLNILHDKGFVVRVGDTEP